MKDRLKVSSQEKEQIQLRSDEVREIMGQIPNRIIRYGISIIAVIIISFISFSFVFKYPEVITGSFYIQSANPPAFMLSATTGKLESLLVSDSDTIEAGRLLAMIENSTNIDAYQKLKVLIEEYDQYSEVYIDSLFPPIKELGSLQSAYATLIKASKGLYNFTSLDYHQQKIALLLKNKAETKHQVDLYQQQLYDNAKSYKLALLEFKRDSFLYSTSTIAMAEFQKSERTKINQKISYTNAHLNLSNAQLTLSDLESQILELRLKKTQELESLQLSLIQALEQIKGQMAEWEKQYCLISPINGRIAFSGVWEENQNIRTGQHVMTVLPLKRSRLVAKLIIPVNKAGKLNQKQKVNLKFTDFPYREYGMVNASLDAISEVPDSAYVGTVFLNDSLISNYGTFLPFKQNMQGVAEIITEDISVAERMVYPLKAILKERL
ncbi:HlyD family efflux transporter periplasmic adaptor subunit [Saccharicrinis aurantiacus]|uniref:HlyD family efflux transporter periplasmic adaptor subunit n=1 Tax=Saccharicrinis aurantiacus TaxID=1849719 RepID=UPI00249074B5|nr:HlyD family efflux transporter periplasmic adaptor subunit [Saccharicrinis aurantiacus]